MPKSEKPVSGSDQSETAQSGTPTDELSKRESGLRRSISSKQMSMIAIGTSIGTGLFLGSGIAIGYAGPGVIVSYVIGAIVALIVMLTLTEITMVHPTAGAFGAHAELYLGPWAGFITRYMYWGAQVVAIGGEATAIGLYMQYWFPSSPAWAWIALTSVLLITLNSISVQNFGKAEYWFSSIKVAAIIAFILLGIVLIFGTPTSQTVVENLVGHQGFFPHGAFGVWMGVLVALFSYFGVEVVAVTAGESSDPKTELPKAFRWQLFRLIIFYILSLTIIVCIVPWDETGSTVVSQSPFVLALSKIGFPFATGVMNFVVLTAALSSMNADLYVCSRMIYSLSKGRQAPKIFGKLTKNGVPIYAIGFSSFGMLVAFILNMLSNKAYNILFGVAIFGGIFVWIMILITFISYRRSAQSFPKEFHSPWAPWLQVLGIGLLLAILITMAFSNQWVFAWYVGVPFAGLVSAIYFVFYRRRAHSNQAHR